MDIENKSITDQQHWCEPRLQIVQWGLLGELISMLRVATYLRKFSSRSVEEYWCYPNYGPPISLRKCVCPTTQAPFGKIPVVGKLGSYSNLQHKKI